MERNHTTAPSNRSWSQNPELTKNFSQRERARHRRLAGTTIPVVILFLFALLPQAITTNNSALIIALFIGLGVCIFALFLNWRGLVTIPGILTLIAVYAGGTFTMLHYPGGLTASDLYLLDLTIIPDLLVLAFFPANSLLPIACINAIQAWAILKYAPHDSTITHLLQTTPFAIFSHVYILQVITAVILYFWVSSTERAIAHTDRVEEIATFERHQKELQKQEMEKKRQLDADVQQILQTHVAVANGDLNARTPLPKDHELWQVAAALNNLIARLQRLSQTEHELKQQIGVEKKHITRILNNTQQTTGQFPKYEQTTGQHPKYEQTTGQFPKYKQTTGQFPKYERTTDQFPKQEGN